MQIIGFNFTQLHGSREQNLPHPYSLSTDVEIVNVEPQKNGTVLKDTTVFRADFSFTLTYAAAHKKGEKPKGGPLATLKCMGNVMLAATGDEATDFEKNWKKEESNSVIKINLINFILRRCTIKALAIGEELGLPPHLPMPHAALPEKKK